MNGIMIYAFTSNTSLYNWIIKAYISNSIQSHEGLDIRIVDPKHGHTAVKFDNWQKRFSKLRNNKLKQWCSHCSEKETK